MKPSSCQRIEYNVVEEGNEVNEGNEEESSRITEEEKPNSNSIANAQEKPNSSACKFLKTEVLLMLFVLSVSIIG